MRCGLETLTERDVRPSADAWTSLRQYCLDDNTLANPAQVVVSLSIDHQWAEPDAQPNISLRCLPEASATHAARSDVERKTTPTRAP
jgi:hypothetical protein